MKVGELERAGSRLIGRPGWRWTDLTHRSVRKGQLRLTFFNFESAIIYRII